MLEIHVTSRNADVTKSMKDYALEKAKKLEKYYGRIHSVDVILDKEHENFVAEIKVGAGRGKSDRVGKKKHADMSAAVDFVVDKMERQLTKLKEKARDHRGVGVGEASSSDVTEVAGAEGSEESYDDVVRGNDL